MVDSNNDMSTSKLSPEFKTRLQSLGPEQKVRAIVVLDTKDASSVSGRRQSPAERRAALEAVRKSASAALPQIDETLEPFDGRRLSKHPNALGAILVEANAAGIMALAASKCVKAILEDQPVSLLEGKKRS
jgi:hypothetical protein